MNIDRRLHACDDKMFKCIQASAVSIVVCDEKFPTAGLILKIEGYAKVQWSEVDLSKFHLFDCLSHNFFFKTEHRNNHHRNRHGGSHHHNGSNTKTIHYSGREDYLNTISYLIGSPEGIQKHRCRQVSTSIETYQFLLSMR